MTRVLVVEDSAVSQQFLVHILEQDPTVQVIGTARDGEEAVAFVDREKPDVITMDIHMPRVDGIEATRRIMETRPVPIVIVSGLWSPSEVATTFRAIDAGAVALVEKPAGLGNPQSAAQIRKLVETVKSMAEVRVVRRWGKRPPSAAVERIVGLPSEPAKARDIQVVAIGVSTGGPPVLRTLLSRIPEGFGAPILIVQHMVAGFLPGLADWLSGVGCPVTIAQPGEMPRPGKVYLAPDGCQMGLDRLGAVALADAPAENGLRPSASYLFRSVAEVWGARSIGILLTGMGRDGALELKALRDCGAITIAQDRESSLVHGMPGQAISLGAAMHVLPPEKVAELLAQIVKKTKG